MDPMKPVCDEPNRIIPDIMQWHDLLKNPDDLPEPNPDGSLRSCLATIKAWNGNRIYTIPEAIYNPDKDIQEWVVLSTLQNGHMEGGKATYREPAGDIIAWMYWPEPYVSDAE